MLRISPFLFRPFSKAHCLRLVLALLVLAPPGQALAGDAAARLADRQPVAPIQQTSYTIPLSLSSSLVSSSPARQIYVPATLSSSQRSALPLNAAIAHQQEVPKLKIKGGKSLKTLPADTSTAAPRLSGFKPLSKDVFLTPPPYLQKMWDNVVAKHDPERVFGKKQQAMNSFRKQQWDNIVAGWRGMSPDKKLRVINGFFNNWPSKSDLHNYGTKEYWAAPEEMLRKGSGDCEDYAILKYFALRYLSWPVNDMWLLLVQDKEKKTHHAVLAARYGSQTFILDNLSKPRYLLIPEEAYMKKYMPFYAINEHSNWIFATPTKGRHTLPRSDDELIGVAENDLVMKR